MSKEIRRERAQHYHEPAEMTDNPFDHFDLGR